MSVRLVKRNFEHIITFTQKCLFSLNFCFLNSFFTFDTSTAYNFVYQSLRILICYQNIVELVAQILKCAI